jgi:CDP-diacylglycerol--serine O-phosphatidyltransferase
MQKTKYLLPNALTLVNLFLGSFAIIIAFKGQNEYNAAWLIILAALFDMLDGWAARLLNAKSEFGKQLDSLADVVSFGVAPAILLFNWLYMVLTKLSRFSTFEMNSANLGQNIILLCSLLYALAAAIRLAKFNISGSSGRLFRGLPTPAAALIIASIWLLINSESKLIQPVILNIYFVLSFIVVIIYLMLSNIRMLSLKFDGAGISKNYLQYLVILAAIIFVVVFRLEGILFALVFYLILSFISAAAGLYKSAS